MICKEIRLNGKGIICIRYRLVCTGRLSAIRYKIVRLTDRGIRYIEQIIPPAAKAEIDAMCELSENDMAELVRITAILSNQMKRKFDKRKEGQL